MRLRLTWCLQLQLTGIEMLFAVDQTPIADFFIQAIISICFVDIINESFN
jgi:hypothetical protein